MAGDKLFVAPMVFFFDINLLQKKFMITFLLPKFNRPNDITMQRKITKYYFYFYNRSLTQTNHSSSIDVIHKLSANIRG